MAAENYVTVDGRRLYYEVHGAGDGNPLLLIAGLGCDLDSWGAQIPAYAVQTRLIAFDSRDTGRSADVSGPYTVADLVTDAVGLLNALDVEQVNVLGHSLGGMVAQELAIRHPQRVGRLVLASTLSQAARMRASLVETWTWLVEHDHGREILPSFLLSITATQEYRQNAEAAAARMAELASPHNPQSPAAFARQAAAWMAFDAADRLGSITAPTLVLVGDQDVVTPPLAAWELAGSIPGARIKILAGCGHGCYWEDPDHFNEAVLEWVSR